MMITGKGFLLCTVLIVKRFRAKKMADAHALCHVTCTSGARNNQKFGNVDPDVRIHYTTFVGLR